ncbi:MAG: cation diffusion facilitator family transporter, partial [Bacillota bacterium]|nr:cation diffusion facilitator family transporter [Bacillota bacterium]
MNENYMNDKDKKKLVIKISWVSIMVNLMLSVLKIIAGLVSGSGAMISDGVHSASDVFSTFVVIFGYTASQKESDKDHQYGHERMECVAAVILASILAFVGLEIGISGIQKIISGVSEGGLSIPGALALWAAVISIIVKEGMFWYT